MMRRTSSRHHLSESVARTGERGTVYIIALLVLVVLSILGLTLALVTQTEMRIGGNELTATRSFYTADAGMQTAVARTLTVGTSVQGAGATTVEPMRLTFDRKNMGGVAGGAQIAEQVEVTPMVPLRSDACDGCVVGDSEDRFYTTNYALAATARRLAWDGGGEDPPADAIPLSQKQTYTQVGVQPWWEPSPDSIRDPEQVDRIVQGGE